MKRKIIGIVVILLVILSFSYYYKAQSRPGDLKITVLAPLSGNLAYFGRDYLDGVNLAVKNENVGGKRITVISKDTQSDTKLAVSAFQNTIAIDKPDVVFSFGNGADRAISGIVDKYKIPTFFTFSSGSGIPSLSSYSFRYFVNADTDAPVMAKYFIENIDANNISILYVNDDFGTDYAKTFTKYLEQNGSKKVIQQEPINYTDMDYSTQLTKLLTNKPDAIYIVAQDYQTLLAISKLKKLKFNGIILTSGTIATKDSIDKAGGNLEGVYLTAFCTDEADSNFKSLFRKEYQKEPGFMSELGYDMVNLVISGGANDKNSVKNALSNVKNYRTSSGQVSADTNGEIIIPTCPKVIKDNKIFNLVTKQYSNY